MDKPIIKKEKKLLVDRETTAIVVSPETSFLKIEDSKTEKVYQLRRTAKGLQLTGA